MHSPDQLARPGCAPSAQAARPALRPVPAVPLPRPALRACRPCACCLRAPRRACPGAHVRPPVLRERPAACRACLRALRPLALSPLAQRPRAPSSLRAQQPSPSVVIQYFFFCITIQFFFSTLPSRPSHDTKIVS